MTNMKMTMPAGASQLSALIAEAADLIATREIPDDLVADVQAVINGKNVASVEDAGIVDGHLRLAVTPAPQFMSVLERLRECPAA